MIKRVKTGLVTALVAVLLITGCGKVVVQKETARRASTGDTWTVMIYMCGGTMEENNSAASEVLSSLSYDLPENINVLVETGGSRQWRTEDIYSDYIQDFVVQKNGIRMVNQRRSESMGDDTTLCRFIEWASDNYPAKHYITILWDHGGGPTGGVVYDSLHSFDSLSLSELKNALTSAGLKQDIIGFDVSLSSNVETASAVSLYADYMVASEDIMPITGWNYKSLFAYLSDNPSASAYEVGKKICDDAADAATGANGMFLSMALTDLSKQSMLSLAVDGAAQAISACDADISAKRTIENLLSRQEYLGGNSQWEGYSNVVDIRKLASSTKSLVGSPSANLIDAVDEAVVYKRMSQYHSGLGGIGIYLPSNRAAQNINAYKSIYTSDSYNEFLERSFTDNYPDSAAHIQYDRYMSDNTFTAVSSIDGSFTLTATHPEVIKNVGVNIYYYNTKQSKYIHIYRDDKVTYMPANSAYQYMLTSKIPQLNGTNISMYLVSRNTGYDIYSIPIIKGGDICNIRVAKADNGEYTVLGLWKGVGKFTGMTERYIGNLNAGDIITPIYEVYGESSRYIEGSDIKIGLTGSVKIEEKRPTDGTYVLSYTVEDIYGNLHETAPATAIAEKGNLKFSTN